MILREKYMSIIRVMQMDNLRGLLGIRRKDKVLNGRIRDLRGVTKVVNQRIDKGVLQRFGHVGRRGNDRITKWVCVGEYMGSNLVS